MPIALAVMVQSPAFPARAAWETNSMNEKHKHLKQENGKPEKELLHEDRGRERDAPMAPEQNRPPSEQHRTGQLPNQKK